MSKTALITGVTGQDGRFLTDFLLKKGYTVYGLSSPMLSIDLSISQKVKLIKCDLSDTDTISSIIKIVQPDELYNLAAQSHVGLSFTMPIYTADINALGVLRILEAIKRHGLINKTRFFQASSAELFGVSKKFPQNEETPLEPNNPYGIAKLYAYWIVKNYRESYGEFASNGIMYNHESEYRPESFVTRKITMAAVNISKGVQDKLYLGNLDSRRDWGYASDFVECMWKILQHDKPDDFVISTGETHSVRDFATIAFKEVGINIEWIGDGLYEKGVDRDNGRIIIEVNPDFFRPSETWELMGNSKKAKLQLGWTHKTSFEQIVKKMVRYDNNI
ncbi:MAG: GDP-mannose 4,6-dehydratase [Sphaerochaetaceae bacterium]|nr:GDP-mannose 4,6-dehydratase [Sphaerochaetaceae bacterium]